MEEKNINTNVENEMASENEMTSENEVKVKTKRNKPSNSTTRGKTKKTIKKPIDSLEGEVIEVKEEDIKVTENKKENSEENVETESVQKQSLTPITPKLSKQDIKKIKKIKKSKTYSLLNAERYEPDLKKGLTSKQVADRIEQGYINYYETNNTKSYRNIFFSNIFTFFNLLCFLIVLALILVGSFNNLFFAVIFICNMTIGIIQEIKAKKTVEKISLVTSPSAKVIRDGIKQEIKTNEVVLDDVLIYEFGNQICTDSIILKGEIEVNESLLTGESVSVKKKKGDLILAGSFVTSGSCLAKAERVAEENYTSKLTLKAKIYSKPKSELLSSLRMIIKVIGVLIIPLGVAIFFNNKAIIGSDLKLLVTKSAGSVIGMIPAGLFLLTSLALAVGVIKLAKKKTLVQDLYGIEMLSRASVLCLDKTGTITDGTMMVKQIKMLKKQDDLNQILSSMLASMKTQNQTFNALKNYFGEEKVYDCLRVLEFNSAKKFSGVSFTNGKTYFLGAPEFVYRNKDKKITNYVNSYAKEGYRVLILCETEDQIEKNNLPKNLTPICLIMLDERIRKEAKETIAWFNSNGVQIKIISGDNPLTVSEISKKVGVIGAEKYISLEGMTNQQVMEIAGEYNIFGRVSPEQKQILVKALKNMGHNVAMTGDGVNDILALKEADCSISVASGSEAARNVSHLVLLDSNFLNLPAVVGEGRRVVNNIVNSASLFLMKTFFTFILTIFCLIVNINYPFTPNQIILLELFTIGIPSFFLALQPNQDKIEGKFINKVALKSVCYGLILFVTFLSCFMFDRYLGTSCYETLASLSITFVGLVILLKICTPLNMFRTILYLGMVAATALALLIMPYESFFSYVPLNVTHKIFIALMAAISFVVLYLPLIFKRKKS